MIPLPPPPPPITTYNEIAIQYAPNISDLWNSLAKSERVMLYFLQRASMVGNRITAGQRHRDALEITQLFEEIVNNASKFSNDFVKDAQTYLVYLWTNHGQYFAREHENEKRSPKRLGLSALTPQSLTGALSTLAHTDAKEVVARLHDSIFSAQVEPTVVVPNNIAASAGNIYSHDFTEQHYQQVPVHERTQLNAYFAVGSDGKPTRTLYKVGGMYGEELAVAVSWLKQAHKHAEKNQKHFDKHFAKSLEYLIAYLESGDEELFKKHSLEWLKTNSRIDYNFGFIETYEDPKSYRGSFQAEATIKTFDLGKLSALLPSFEGTFPFPDEFKRDTSATTSIPNASMNTKVFGFGHLGPMFITAAYCLPNYEEIRAKNGSKQIIYQSDKSIGERRKPELSRALFNLKDDAAWLAANDPENKMSRDIWDLQCILHETLGHGSGKLATHASGTVVTSANLKEYLVGFEQTMEEMRAEIIALYVSVMHIEELAKAGFMTQWLEKLGKEGLQRRLICGMTNTALRRLYQLSDDAKEVAGDHARANVTITTYLCEGRGLEMAQEELEAEGKSYTVLTARVTDLEKVKAGITELMQEVQRIKSTGDGDAAKNLVTQYGTPLNKHYYNVMKENIRAISGDVKATAHIFPHFEPVLDKKGKIVEVSAVWPKDIFEQHFSYAENALSKV